jgi:DNA repair protein RadC
MDREHGQEYGQGHRARLRERLRRDACALADYEVLELILGLAQIRRDTKPLAKQLLKRFVSIRGVLNARDDELLDVPGFSAGTLALWRLLRELMARHAESQVCEQRRVTGPRDVADMARARLAGCAHEEIWAALLDTGNRIIAWIRMEEGTVGAAALHVRKLLEAALLRKASGIILVHNHPGGLARPSPADTELTRRLNRAAGAVGISLHDHLVLTENGYYSFSEAGMPA